MGSQSELGLAIITGAAGGLGLAFAKKLAKLGHPLLLVDRRPDALQQVCDSISAEYGVVCKSHVANLCNRDEIGQLAHTIGQLPHVDMLVNNAGFGTLKHFVDTEASVVAGMVDLHVVAPMMFTHAVLPGMIERDKGAIINVSSVSAWFHSAGNTHYGSTKICLAVFTATLHEELCGTNVRVQALCPGFVRTQFHEADGMKDFHKLAVPVRMWAMAEDVVDFSLSRLARRQPIAIPGLGYRVIGRLAQMPLFRPLFRRITRVPRAVPIVASTIQSSPTSITGLAANRAPDTQFEA